MASSETNKELLDFEQQTSCSPESRLVICKKSSSLPKKSKRKESNEQPLGSRLTNTVAAKSQVIGKVKNFLDVIAQANRQLETRMQENPQVNYDIEALSGNESEIIEMDLLLGVADLQTSEALEAAEAAIGGPKQWRVPLNSEEMDVDEDSFSDDGEGSDSDSTDNENDEKSCTGQKQTRKSAKLPAGGKPQKQPKIVILN